LDDDSSALIFIQPSRILRLSGGGIVVILNPFSK